MKRIFLLLLVIYSGCYKPREHSVSAVATRAVGPSLLLDPGLVQKTDLSCRQSVMDFYGSRNYRLFWTDSTGRRPQADSLIYFIAHSDREGLIPTDYHLQNIKRLLADTVAMSAAYLDVLLTDAFLTLHHHMSRGRLDRTTLERSDLSTTADRVALVSLQRLSTGSLKTEFETLEPSAIQYHELKNALTRFRLPGKEDLRQQERARKISLNMERWRWQVAWPDRYILVNIPAFRLKAVEQDSVWLTSPVIVGKRETPTPVMESVIRSFIIYPYWHAPESISIKEILPEVQKDRSYLENHNFEVLNKKGVVIRADTIQWDAYGEHYFPFIFRQREGAENSMGIIKFNFANPYGVYLHDTNSKRLFRRAKRDLSHGCVRVSEAVNLAHYLVREDDIYVSPEDLDQYLSLQQRLEITLRKPIAVKLEYFTCEVEKGVPYFYDDIYRKDSVMMHSLYAPSLPRVTNENPSF